MHGMHWMHGIRNAWCEKSFWNYRVQRLNGIFHQISSKNRNIFPGESAGIVQPIWSFDLVSDFQVAEHWGHCRAHSAYKVYQVSCLPQGRCFCKQVHSRYRDGPMDFCGRIRDGSLEGAASGTLALMPFVPCSAVILQCHALTSVLPFLICFRGVFQNAWERKENRISIQSVNFPQAPHN